MLVACGVTGANSSSSSLAPTSSAREAHDRGSSCVGCTPMLPSLATSRQHRNPHKLVPTAASMAEDASRCCDAVAGRVEGEGWPPSGQREVVAGIPEQVVAAAGEAGGRKSGAPNLRGRRRESAMPSPTFSFLKESRGRCREHTAAALPRPRSRGRPYMLRQQATAPDGEELCTGTCRWRGGKRARYPRSTWTGGAAP